MKKSEALKVYEQVEKKQTSFVAAITYEARILARLQTKRTKLRKDLKELDRQIRVTKQNLKRVVANTEGIQMPPLRVFGETQGGKS